MSGKPIDGAQAQGGGDVDAEDLRWCEDIADSLREAGGPTNNMRLVALNRLLRHARTAPPSAPVGVEVLVGNWKARAETKRAESKNKDWAEWLRENHAGAASAFTTCARELSAALAQQPAAVDGVWLSKARSLYDRCSLYPETKPDGMTALLELRNHVYSILATQHQEPTT